jgi:hypothetical protein
MMAPVIIKLPPAELAPDPNDATRWQCEMGHIFAASFNQVKADEDCPKCKVDKLTSAIRWTS